jgi:hypothetical protein
VRIAAELWWLGEPAARAGAIAVSKYDEVVQARDRFIARFDIRYVALAADNAAMGYREARTRLRRGPYWQNLGA